MKSNIKISVCIPTYNRSSYLMTILENLNSIEDKDVISAIEICISDNASTDDTEVMVSNWIDKGKINIKYSRNVNNEGADKNYLKAVDLATGEYCWLFGSDDLFVDNAIKSMLERIYLSESDIYICNRVNCDVYMNPTGKQKWLSKKIVSREFDFKNSNDLVFYFDNSESLGAVFSYLSCIVFKRSCWVSQVFDDSYLGSAYSHVYYLLGMVKSGCTLFYVDDFLVLNRGDNDSFLKDGRANRVLIDLYGYSKLADDFFINTIYYIPFLNILRKKERKQIRTIVSLRYYCSNENEWGKSKFILRKLEYSEILIFLSNIFKPIINLARDFYLKVMK